MKNKKYFIEIELNKDNNKIKILKTNKLVGLNQFKRTWRKSNSRKLARQLNKMSLVIN